MAKTYTADQIAAIDGGKTALALTGHAPYGDAVSVRNRLDVANKMFKDLEHNVKRFNHLPNDEVVKEWKQELKVWQFVIAEGEKLFERLSQEQK